MVLGIFQTNDGLVLFYLYALEVTLHPRQVRGAVIAAQPYGVVGTTPHGGRDLGDSDHLEFKKGISHTVLEC